MKSAAASLDPSEPEESEENLWEACSRRSDKARLALIEKYMPLADKLARHEFRTRRGADFDFQDIRQLALAGLVEGVDRFDFRRGTPFKYYASHRIRGSIRNGLVHSSEAREQLSWKRRHQKDRLASLKSDAGSQRSAVDELADLAVGLAIGFLLEETGMIREHEGGDPTTPFDTAAWHEVVCRLDRAIASLSDRERSILNWHYKNEMRFEDMAKLLKLSKARVSQLHRGALDVLRKKMTNVGHFAGKW
jgi:RNA polymerase sigma factor FliA